MKFQEKLDKLNQTMSKVQTNKYLQALSGGMMSLLPIMVIGSISALLSQLNIAPYQAFIMSTGIHAALTKIFTVTMNFMALYVVFLIGHKLAESFDEDGLLAGMISIMAFMIITPLTTFDKSTALEITYLGSRGLFVGMMSALIATRIYVFVIQKNITIKMPNTVPPVVSKTFTALIPAIFVAIVFGIMNGLFALTSYGNAHAALFAILQVPLQSMGSNIFTVVILVALMEVLWFFGIHGSNVVNPILLTVFYSMDVANLEAFQAGATVLPYIITVSFIQNQKGPRNLALAIILSFNTKSQHLKKVGRLGLVPAFFGISEPLKFGLPMILNPILAIPMILTPVASVLLSYVAIVVGFLPQPNGVSVPSGTPELLRPLFTSGVRGVIFGLFLLVVCMVIYWPFVRAFDKQKLREEAALEA
ncbi:PTS sugar transporter subunit IIC [Erysipelothrix urinaevulpis]|uniref:PTS sugar transporter subunit IIC n=1 Tax=Erysipelothrix urinaevulpis TaxID=2683717 RepID=UPI00135799AD|nr:PTS transporter subunit EIIC [Erysipelothrix urinaevulpis]